jgi:flotillin
MSTALLVMVAGVSLALLGAVAFTLRRTICLATPNEVLILSGSHRRVGDAIVGYRAVRGGRAVRVPLLEVVDILDLSPLSVTLGRVDVTTRDHLRLQLELVASIHPGAEEPLLGRALECVLGRTREELLALVEPVVRGTLLGLARQLTAAQIIAEPAAVAEQLREEQEYVLGKLGLVLETVRVHAVPDAYGYERALVR